MPRFKLCKQCVYDRHIFLQKIITGIYILDNTRGCGILVVRPPMAMTGSPVLIEFYSFFQLKIFAPLYERYTITRNNVTNSFPDERHKMIETSEMRHVLEVKSVTPEDAGDYRVDCGSYLGTTNTDRLHVTGLCLCCPYL